MIRPGDLVLYKRRGCDSYELGYVKSTQLDPASGSVVGAFVYYSAGETAANTPADCLFEFENDAWRTVLEHSGVSDGIKRLRSEVARLTYEFAIELEGDVE